jgi:hypothetical protein
VCVRCWTSHHTDSYESGSLGKRDEKEMMTNHVCIGTHSSGKNMRKIHTIWYVIIPCPKMVLWYEMNTEGYEMITVV